MNAIPSSYHAVTSPTKSPRDAEAAILARITARMISASGRGSEGFAQLGAALDENRKFWTAAATDLAHDGNGLPVDLRARMLSIAGFVLRHSPRVLAGAASVEPLVEINRAIIGGLSPAPVPA